MFKKVAMFILAIGIITTTTVYAKDIVNFIANIFTNSNRGIDKAVDNGYIQNVDMDYIICNNVGVKVDYLLMDDKNLDISFVYHYLGEITNIQNISASELTIKDEKNNILYLKSKENIFNNNIILGNEIFSNNEQRYIDKHIRDSLLITSENFPNSQILYIQISEITLLTDNETLYTNGSWDFSIKLDTNFVTRNFYEYISSTSPYIDNIYASLTDTSLTIELQLNTSFNEIKIYDRNSTILKDNADNIYRPIKMLSQNYDSFSTITLFYPITIYDNIDTLYLHIDFDIDKQIDLELTK